MPNEFRLASHNFDLHYTSFLEALYFHLVLREEEKVKKKVRPKASLQGRVDLEGGPQKFN